MAITAPYRGFAIVTGASSGIGREMARLLAHDGYSLLLVARQRDALEALAAELPTHADILVQDLSHPPSYRTILSWLDERAITPTILINNAGFGAFDATLTQSHETIERMMTLNMVTLTQLSRAVAERMVNAGRGRILNVASTAAFQPCPYLNVYGATKTYVLHFSEGLSEECRGTGVTVTALCPGPTRTAFGVNAGLLEDSPFDQYAMDAVDVARQGLYAMHQGKTVVVTGLLNRLVATFVSYLPRAWVRRIAARGLRKMR